MKASTKKRIWEILTRFAVFSVTSGAGTLVDLGVHWWLAASFLQERYWWTFWVAPVISFELAVLTNFLIAYYFVWRERISKRSTRVQRTNPSCATCWPSVFRAVSASC